MPRPDRAWIARLSASEQKALAESEAFFFKPDGKILKALAQVGRPLDAMLKKSPRALQNALTTSIHSVLETVAAGSEDGNYRRELINDLCQISGMELEPWSRIFTVNLSKVEALALGKLKAARKLALVQGGVTGIAGAPGLIADIPTLYYLVFRTVNQIAICFGHPITTDADRRYLLQVVNVGHHLEWRERRCALLELDQLEAESPSSASSQDLQRTLLAKSLQGLARKLAAKLIARKAAQTIALVGSAVGAVINRQLVNDIGSTAFHAYRRRFLFQAAQSR